MGSTFRIWALCCGKNILYKWGLRYWSLHIFLTSYFQKSTMHKECLLLLPYLFHWVNCWVATFVNQGLLHDRDACICESCVIILSEQLVLPFIKKKKMAQVEKWIVRMEPTYNHLEKTSAKLREILEIVPLWGLTFTSVYFLRPSDDNIRQIWLFRRKLLTVFTKYWCMFTHYLDVGDMAMFFNKFDLFALVYKWQVLYTN